MKITPIYVNQKSATNRQWFYQETPINSLSPSAGSSISRDDFTHITEKLQKQRFNPSFGKKVNLHFPIENVKIIFAKALEEITAAKTIEEKIKAADNCVNEFGELNKKVFFSYGKLEENIDLFCKDRAHEIKSTLNNLFEFGDRIESKIRRQEDHGCSIEEYMEACKNAFSATIKSIERYEFFLNKGLEKSTMEPNNVFKMALDYANEYSKNNTKIKIIGESILNKYKTGIHTWDGRMRDYDLYTVFANLIQNAIKYSPDGGEIEIKFATRKINAKDHLIFSILDSGMGIPREEQKKVLMKGYRASNAARSGIKGDGYGLSRVNTILQDANSYLEIKSPITNSVEYSGTEITCFIRLKEAA